MKPSARATGVIGKDFGCPDMGHWSLADWHRL